MKIKNNFFLIILLNIFIFNFNKINSENNQSVSKLNIFRIGTISLGITASLLGIFLYIKTNENCKQEYLTKEEKLFLDLINEDIALNGEDKKLKIDLASNKKYLEIRFNLTIVFENISNILKKIDHISSKIFKIIGNSLLKEGYYKDLKINPYNYEVNIEKRTDKSYILILNFKIEEERAIKNYMNNYDNSGKQIGQSVYYTYSLNPTLGEFFEKKYEYLNDDKKVFKEYYYYNSFNALLMNYLWWNSLKNIFGFSI